MKKLKPFGDPLIIVITREMVESGNIDSTLEILKRLIESPEIARVNMEKVEIMFDGYDNIKEELCEMPEVRDYIHCLDDKFPYWLFFLTKHMLGLQCVMYCFLLPYLTDKAKAEHHPEALGKLLLNRWGPAMEHIAGFAGLSDTEAEALALSVQEYIEKGL